MLRPTVIAIPLFALLIAIETYLAVRHAQEDYDRKDAWTNIALGFGSVLFGAIFGLIQAFFYEMLYAVAPYQMPMNAWWAWAILLFVDDFAYYCFHRVEPRGAVFLEFSRRSSFVESI